MDRQARRGDLPAFFAITFAFSWSLWLLPLLRSNGLLDLPEEVGILGLLAPFGPGVAAFWLVWRRAGRAGVRTLWRRGWKMDFDKAWLAPTFAIGPLLALLSVGLVLLVGGDVDWEEAIPPAMVLPIFLLIYFTNALPEEYGWRGYALAPLQQRFGALGASLALGLIWGLWHLPLVFIDGTTQAAIPFHEFILQTMLLAIIYTWLFNNTGGSILVAALFHATANTAGAAVPTWTTPQGRWMGFIALAAITSVIVWRWGWQRLSRSEGDPDRTPGSFPNETPEVFENGRLPD